MPDSYQDIKAAALSLYSNYLNDCKLEAYSFDEEKLQMLHPEKCAGEAEKLFEEIVKLFQDSIKKFYLLAEQDDFIEVMEIHLMKSQLTLTTLKGVGLVIALKWGENLFWRSKYPIDQTKLIVEFHQGNLRPYDLMGQHQTNSERHVYSLAIDDEYNYCWKIGTVRKSSIDIFAESISWIIHQLSAKRFGELPY